MTYLDSIMPASAWHLHFKLVHVGVRTETSHFHIVHCLLMLLPIRSINFPWTYNIADTENGKLYNFYLLFNLVYTMDFLLLYCD